MNSNSVKLDTPLFHGTTAPTIQRFQLGNSQYGETDEPVNAIWMSTSYEGAKWHAISVAGRIRNAQDVYVYEWRLTHDAKIADTRTPKLPADIHKQFVKRFRPLYLRIADRLPISIKRKILSDEMWFRDVLHALEKIGTEGYNEKFNGVIAICKDMGIDLLVAPSTTLNGNGLAHWDEPKYGHTALLINLEKIVFVSREKF